MADNLYTGVRLLAANRQAVILLASKATMKYPSHTISKPIVGKAAKKVISAVKEGRVISNSQAEATAKRIAKRYLKYSG